LEATTAAVEVSEELQLSSAKTVFYSDSQIVLGYLNNTTRRFSKYVSRRIELILNMSRPLMWHYVRTDENPADIATRPHDPCSLKKTNWFKGPEFLWRDKNVQNYSPVPPIITVELPEQDFKNFKVSDSTETKPPLSRAYNSISRWERLLQVTKVVCSAAGWLDRARQKLGTSLAPRSPYMFVTEPFVSKTLIQTAQKEHFTDLTGSIASLSPFIDVEGTLRVGGRLRNAFLPTDGKHPVILPTNHPLSVMIIRHHHEKVMHQGRVITHGALREAGFHIVGCRGMIDRIIRKCVICRRLRSMPQQQRMADLPADRLEESPPFTNTGVDLFGPFSVTDGVTTRRTNSTKKVWGVLFTCLVSRAIHIETVPGLDTSSFRNALRRFFALRGTCKKLRSDNGTNFVGTRNQIEAEFDFSSLKHEASKHGCEWSMNPPGASHFGGVWETKIGAIRRILDAAFLQAASHAFTRDELNTIMQEAAAIVNNTPMYPVSCKPDDPTPITPAMLLLLRDHPNPAPPEQFSSKELNCYGKTRWKRVQVIAEEFWRRWRRYYLQTLQGREKWRSEKPSLKEGDLVMIKDKVSPRNTWPTGIISATKLSQDGLVRSAYVDVCAKNGAARRTLHRSSHDLVLLLPLEK
jgi:hypothetical protein